jgi:hypothetical protein
MPLKCLDPDGIRPLAGRPQSSALVCSVHNKSSLLIKFRFEVTLFPRSSTTNFSKDGAHNERIAEDPGNATQ